MRTCEGCGAEVGQTDITQRDADGNTWHCVCADNALAKYKRLEDEKERCRKLAVEYALQSDEYKIKLERCENMKLAREFESLLQTTSIPVAVDRVKKMQAVVDAARSIKNSECHNCGGPTKYIKAGPDCIDHCTYGELRKALTTYDEGKDD